MTFYDGTQCIHIYEDRWCRSLPPNTQHKKKPAIHRDVPKLGEELARHLIPSQCKSPDPSHSGRGVSSQTSMHSHT